MMTAQDSEALLRYIWQMASWQFYTDSNPFNEHKLIDLTWRTFGYLQSSNKIADWLDYKSEIAKTIVHLIDLDLKRVSIEGYCD